jgi:hypothetical protein
MLPTYFNTPADFASGITIGVTSESLVLEFKREIKMGVDEAKEFCRDVAQFANSDGGCLFIGVEEKLDPVTKLKTASGIKPVAEPDKLIKWLEQAIRNWLVPATFSHPIAPLHTPLGIVLAVNVTPSQHTVYLWDDQSHTIEVPHRTNHGKDWMNPDELERHIMNGSRAAKLRVEETISGRKQSPVELVGGVFYFFQGQIAARDSEGTILFGDVGSEAFELKIPVGTDVPTLHVPYEAVEAAWVSSSGTIMLMLNKRVVWRGRKEITLLPYSA